MTVKEALDDALMLYPGVCRGENRAGAMFGCMRYRFLTAGPYPRVSYNQVICAALRLSHFILSEVLRSPEETRLFLCDLWFLRGFSVYTYDHHGQGLSGRLPVPDGADLTVAHITSVPAWRTYNPRLKMDLMQYL